MKRLVALALVAALLPGCIEDTNDPAVEAEDMAAPDQGAPDEGPMIVPDAGMDPVDAMVVEPDAAPPPPPPCGNEDELAPNQRPEDAAEVEPGFDSDALFLCPETADWFRVTLRADQVLQVFLLADPPEVDLDIAVLDADGELLAESAADGGRERIELQAPAAGEYLVRVTGYRDEAAFYGLKITSGCALDAQCPDGQLCDRGERQCVTVRESVCGDDAYEENDRDDQAAPLPAEGAEGVLCTVDRDWFSLEAEAGDSYDLLVAFDDGVDIDVTVIEAATGAVVAAARGDQRVNPERLRLANLPAGRYLVGLQMFVDGRDREANYRIEVVGRSGMCRADRDCANDLYPRCDGGVCRPIEANGDVPPGGQCGDGSDCDAQSEGCYTGGSGGHDNFCTRECEGDDDCADIEGGHCRRVGRGFAVCYPGCVDDDDCSAFRACEEGVCALRGECASDRDCDGEAVCRLTRFGRLCGLPDQPSGCGVDADLDPNDVMEEASPLAADGEAVEGLNICDDDTDWYRITVPAEAAAYTLSVGVEFRRGVDIDLYVFDANGRPMGEATSADQVVEFVEIRYIAPGDYLVQVDQFSSDSLRDTQYQIVAELVDNEDRCTVEGGECNHAEPLRAVCDEETGACLDLQGEGALPLGAICDSQDDCGPDAEVCWVFEGGAQGYNICTITCGGDGDCAGIEGTECTPFQGGQFAVCLPPR